MSFRNAYLRFYNCLTNIKPFYISNNYPVIQCVRHKSLEEKVGLPPKPKRPLTPYFRFLKEIRPTLAHENPKANAQEIVKLVAARWEKAEPKTKEKLENEYKKEQELYMIERLKYDGQLTQEDKAKLLQARRVEEVAKEKREQRKKRKEFEKPKRGASGFVLWMKTQFPDRGNLPFREFQNKVAEKWHKMTDAEKKPFVEQSKKDTARYKEEMALWEEKMIRLGNIDVIRASSYDSSEKQTDISTNSIQQNNFKNIEKSNNLKSSPTSIKSSEEFTSLKNEILLESNEQKSSVNISNNLIKPKENEMKTSTSIQKPMETKVDQNKTSDISSVPVTNDKKSKEPKGLLQKIKNIFSS